MPTATTPPCGPTSRSASAGRPSASTSTRTRLRHCAEFSLIVRNGALMTSFDGKVAVVTGAGSGIGRQLAIGLARRGASLAISDVDEEGLNGTAERVAALNAKAHVEVLDVSDRSAVQTYASSVAAHYGVVAQIDNTAWAAA